MRYFRLLIALLAGAMLTVSTEAQSVLRQITPQAAGSGSYLGVMLVDVNADRAAALKIGDERGVEITNVEPGSPAENAGLKPGDVLLTYNGENILGVQQFVRLVQETPPGRRVKIQVWRDGKIQAVTATTTAPRPVNFPHIVGFDFPDVRGFTADFPDPILVWKNSLLGIECEPVDSQLAQYFGVKHGALVRSVVKGSAAENAGLRAGDVLISVGDKSIFSPRDLSSYVRTNRQPGKPVAITLMRDHRELSLTVTPDRRE
jgi:serine protease Do